MSQTLRRCAFRKHMPLHAKSVMEFVGIDTVLYHPKYGNCACYPHFSDENGPRRSTKCFMGIHPGAHLAQETATQRFVDCPDHLVRTAALTTVYRNSSIRPFEECYKQWNEIGQQVL
ncbi:hypothetical protein TNCV_1605921 [Trichonephila clavipes]|nr:hypothetical protein TNCV_1605921 [Trichonephila clavipes]